MLEMLGDWGRDGFLRATCGSVEIEMNWGRVGRSLLPLLLGRSWLLVSLEFGGVFSEAMLRYRLERDLDVNVLEEGRRNEKIIENICI